MQGFRGVLENRSAILRAEAADRSGPLNGEGHAPRRFQTHVFLS